GAQFCAPEHGRHWNMSDPAGKWWSHPRGMEGQPPGRRSDSRTGARGLRARSVRVEAVKEVTRSRLWVTLTLAQFRRRTVAAHLEARGVPRRVNRCKMTDDDLNEAARRYNEGDSLAKVALAFDG